MEGSLTIMTAWTSMWARGWASSVTRCGAGNEGRWATWHEAVSATKKVLGLYNQRETGNKLRQNATSCQGGRCGR